jgi:hypothetical protein
LPSARFILTIALRWREHDRFNVVAGDGDGELVAYARSHDWATDKHCFYLEKISEYVKKYGGYETAIADILKRYRDPGVKASPDSLL